MFKQLFALRGELPAKTRLIIEISGLLLLALLWFLFTDVLHFFRPGILPSPSAVFGSFADIMKDDDPASNILFSLQINLMGYLEAVAVAIPLGFIIGLFPLFKNLSNRYVDAIRFIPLTAVIGLFIAWFGIETNMKVQFLAFGIFVYLLPVVVQRVAEVDNIYVQTSHTLGATNWQKIRTVFLPAVLSKLFDDIRVLVAISWTYIITAEVINKSAGGIGALISTAQRQSRVDKMFAWLLVIVLIGFIQDKIFKLLDRLFFPHKYV